MERTTFRRSLYVAIPLLSVLVSLLGAEAAWRIYTYTGNPQSRWHPDLYYTEQPSAEWTYRSPEFSASIRTNSDGFRGPEFPTQKDPDTTRIVVIGDSIVAAKQVAEELRFTDLLNKELPENVEVIALGIDGADLMREIQYWRVLGRGLEPDIVIQTFYTLNDTVLQPDSFTFLREEEKLYVSSVHIPEDTAKRDNSGVESKFLKAVWAFVQRKIERTTTTADAPEENRADVLGSFVWLTDFGLQELDEKGVWDATVAVLRSMQREIESTGAEYAVLIIPSAMEIQTDWQQRSMDQYKAFVTPQEWDLDGIENRLSAELAAENIPFFSVREAFQKAHDNGSTLYYRLDPHFNEEGHRIVADVVTEYLKSNGL